MNMRLPYARQSFPTIRMRVRWSWWALLLIPLVFLFLDFAGSLIVNGWYFFRFILLN